MKISVLGTGMVGHELATRLISKNHEVMMGARSASNEKALKWSEANGANAFVGTFKDAAAFSDEIIINCTKGEFVLDVLDSIGAAGFQNKLLVDVSNPLDFSNGMPPTLSICNTTSMAEQIQERFPDLKLVKSLNTMSCEIMLNPAKVAGDHNVFMSGNHEDAKSTFAQLLNSFGWAEKNIIDLGDISTARGTEMLLPIWLRLYGALGTSDFNFKIVQ